MEIALDYYLAAGLAIAENRLIVLQAAFSYPHHGFVCISRAAGQTSSPSLT
jgi:hypothetical protein